MVDPDPPRRVAPLLHVPGPVDEASLPLPGAPPWPRGERDARLAASDWTQAADAPLSKGAKAGWTQYRAALRALPESRPDPASIEWPVPPGAAST